MLKKISAAATEDFINICLSVHLEGVKMGSVEQVFQTNLMSHLSRFGSVQFPQNLLSIYRINTSFLDGQGLVKTLSAAVRSN